MKGMCANIWGICVHAYVHAHSLWFACVGQMTTCRRFSPPTIWTQWSKLRLSGWWSLSAEPSCLPIYSVSSWGFWEIFIFLFKKSHLSPIKEHPQVKKVFRKAAWPSLEGLRWSLGKAKPRLWFFEPLESKLHRGWPGETDSLTPKLWEWLCICRDSRLILTLICSTMSLVFYTPVLFSGYPGAQYIFFFWSLRGNMTDYLL